MIEGKLSSGFEFTISEGLATDAAFLRAVTRLYDKKTSNAEKLDALFDAVSTVFNNEAEEERFYKFLAAQDSTGRASIEAVQDGIDEIINYCREHDDSIKK